MDEDVAARMLTDPNTIGGRLIALALARPRRGYEPDRGACLSCGRCFASCPIDHLKRHGGPGRYTEVLAAIEKK